MLESHAKAYLSAAADDAKSIDTILKDYAPNAILVATVIPASAGAEPDGTKFTKINTTPDGIRSQVH